MAGHDSLAILHVLRAPVGGLFRHVVDLARAQAARGHRVGMVADSLTGGRRAAETFAQLTPHLSLGITRLPMSRHIGWSDVLAVRHVSRRMAEACVDVVHGHGAKGGAFARLANRHGAVRVYTPHGGSLHYRRSSPIGLLYLTLEQVLASKTELFLFESAYGRDTFVAKVGQPRGIVRVVHNGLAPDEFAPATPDVDARDLLFIGELRTLKGVDVLIDAIAALKRQGRAVSAAIVGDGPDRQAFEQRAASLGSAIQFPGAMAAREAFRRGRVMVVPSRAESLPYVVLEAAAAGLPLIATSVGGISEIFGPQAAELVPPGDAAALAAKLAAALPPSDQTAAEAARLRDRVATHFSLDLMADQVLEAYAQARASVAS